MHTHYFHNCTQSHEALAILGLHSIEQLLNHLAYQRDWQAWQQLMDMLVPVVHAMLDGVLETTHHLQVSMRLCLSVYVSVYLSLWWVCWCLWCMPYWMVC